MDFPTAWAIAREKPVAEHDSRCSYAQTAGGVLCDCEVLTQHPQYLQDDREPKTCPRCGQVCIYDGWDHVHPSGLGIGSCTNPPGLRQGVMR